MGVHPRLLGAQKCTALDNAPISTCLSSIRKSIIEIETRLRALRQCWNWSDAGYLLWHTEAVLRFQRVTETDEAGATRLVSLEVTDEAVYRTSKSQMWEGRLPLAAVINLKIARSGSSDLVTADTKHGPITWSLKNGRRLIDAIETQRA